MTYKETIEYLYSQLPMFERQGNSGYKSGLDNTIALDEHFGHPHRQYITIHVAGTNGKGSCSNMLAAFLQTIGYKVGLYTSPHLVDFRERIRVNGRMVSEQYVVDFISKERKFFTPLQPSFFEITTAMAFKYFADMKVDIAIIEVGLGGRLDCTNIITPVLSIITNISFDHTQFLGDTLSKIAAEKAGIIKKGVPVIVGETNSETRPVFENKAKKMQTNVIFAEDPDNKEILEVKKSDNSTLLYYSSTYGYITSELQGLYQEKNINTVLVAINQLREMGYVCKCFKERSKEIITSEINKALNNINELTGFAGRWQVLKNVPLVVCDTGHNLAGWNYISNQIKETKCKTMHIVFGMVNDKDLNGVLDLLPKNAIYYFTQADNHRAIPWLTIMDKATAKGLYGTGYNTVKEAFAHALRHAAHDDMIFVGGSSYVVADLLKNCF